MIDPTIRKLEKLMERGSTEGERETGRHALEKREKRLGYDASVKTQERRLRMVRKDRPAAPLEEGER